MFWKIKLFFIRILVRDNNSQRSRRLQQKCSLFIYERYPVRANISVLKFGLRSQRNVSSQIANDKFERIRKVNFCFFRSGQRNLHSLDSRPIRNLSWRKVIGLFVKSKKRFPVTSATVRSIFTMWRHVKSTFTDSKLQSLIMKGSMRS